MPEGKKTVELKDEDLEKVNEEENNGNDFDSHVCICCIYGLWRDLRTGS